MIMEISEHVLTISGGYIELEQGLELGQAVEIRVVGSVINITDMDNQDGTAKRIYKVKGTLAEAKTDFVDGEVIAQVMSPTNEMVNDKIN